MIVLKMIILKPFIFVVWKVFVFGEIHNGCFYIERAANIGDEKEIVMSALIFVCSGLPESGVDVLDNGIADWNNNLNVELGIVHYHNEAPDGFGCGDVADLLQLNMQTMAKKPPLQSHEKALRKRQCMCCQQGQGRG
ncbi:hypothetical protein F2Q70_00032623 [Brassica cretica]|uniref:Uncharacterized protein n=1 Tax=Brassica cretica TaxID=69181 RepID=A0A8S9H5H2_BRACR|nr:hypothetical protein F2Q70_00032623 [Brassica cretica]KAF2552376.1 hypothetical protein F2Q68_00036984 [Brassica cretica]